MTATGDQVQHVVELMARDLTATLGWDQRRAEGLADRIARLYVDWWEPGGDSFAFRVAEAVQEAVLEDRTDTSWPACPLHPHHPLWLTWDHDPPIWQCTTTGTHVASLGGLLHVRQA